MLVPKDIDGSDLKYNGEPIPPVCIEKPHPHLLAAQHFGNKYPSLSKISKLDLNMKLKITKSNLASAFFQKQYAPAGWNIPNHTAHLVMVVSIQNLRSDKSFAKGYGQMTMLLFNLYDVRYNKYQMFPKIRYRTMLTNPLF